MRMTYRDKSIILKCHYCGKSFHPIYSRGKTSKYCSFKCMGKDRKGKLRPDKKTGKYIKCKMCGKGFYVQKCRLKIRKRKFCSKQCYWKFISFQKTTKICLICNKEFLVPLRRKNIAKYCSWECSGIANREEKNHLWRGGITPLNHKVRTSPKFKNWRKKIYKRDNWTCQITKQRGHELHTHHIVSFKSILNEIRYAYKDREITFERAMRYSFLWDIENGITLTKEFHKEYHKSN